MPLNLEPMQGVWDVVELEIEGRAMPSHMLTGSRIEIVGDSFVSLGMGADYSGTITGDESDGTLDLLYTAGPHAGKASLAVYELNGDTMRMCLCLAGGTRPVELKTTPGSGHALELLRKRTTEPRSLDTPSIGQPNTTSEMSSNYVGEPSDPDLDLLSGIWTMTAGARNGEPFPAQFLSHGKRTATREEVTVTFGGQVFVKARYSIDSATTPKTINYVLIEGPEKGAQQQGIYRLDGDVLQTYMSSPGQARPVDFTPEPGDARTFAVWKRDS